MRGRSAGEVSRLPDEGLAPSSVIAHLPDGEAGTVSAAVAEPVAAGETTPNLALTHGAGGNRDTPGLVALAEDLAGRGVRTVRFNLPGAEAGRKRPDRAERAIACVAAVAGWVAERYPGPLFVGGRSFGGRMASLLLADGDSGLARSIAGAVFLAYPLKPPGKPEVPPERKEHLGRIGVPMLFVSGSRDPFAPRELLEPVVAAAGGDLCWIEGGDHGFRVAKAVLTETRRTAGEVRGEIAGAVADFITAVAAGR